jgi:uncharacterized protein (TIGR02996 family)
MAVYDLPEYAAFIAAIKEAPDDDLPRLVAADWLEEKGEENRAKFIRVQCSDYDGEEFSLVVKSLMPNTQMIFPSLSGVSPNTAILTHWATLFRDWSHAGDGARLTYRRGFIHSLRIRELDWCSEEARKIRRRHPLRSVTMLTTAPMDIEVARERAGNIWPGIEFQFEWNDA